MGNPEPAIDVAKRMCDPFLSADAVERVFCLLKKELEESFVLMDYMEWTIEDVNVLPILILAVDAIRMEWQSNQKKYEASSTTKLCTASANVQQVMPDLFQISMACQGTRKQLKNGMMKDKAFAAIGKVVEEAKQS